MSIPKYQEYRDSGVEWLGNVPAHWDALRLKRLFQIKKRIVNSLSFDVLSITQRGIRRKDIESGEGQLSGDYTKYQLVNPGDFAMNQMDLLTGFVDISKYRGVTSPDYRVFVSSLPEENDSRFLLALLQNAYYQKLFFPYGQGAAHLGRWRLPTEEFYNFIFPKPPKCEQTQIARFLDHETAKIDALIKEQERLIGLLQEKRQAVISHAVTKGLDPNVPMKDSGVEWLGEVPAHWDILRLKHVLKEVVDTEHKTVHFVEDGGYLVVRTSNVRDGKLIRENARYTDHIGFIDWTKRGIPKAGDIIFTREAPAGEACIVPSDIPVCLGQRTVLLRLNKKLINEKFCLFSIYSGAASRFIDNLSQGSTVAHLNMSDIPNMPMLVPSLTEQEQISAFVQKKIEEYEQLIEAAKSNNLLLKERRSALISAAVTGKIDVRNWQPPVDESAFDEDVRQAGMEVTA